jgi:hypothetical protein
MSTSIFTVGHRFVNAKTAKFRDREQVDDQNPQFAFRYPRYWATAGWSAGARPGV